jgi:polar amino acid transport system substrate-binding protein
MIIYIFVYSHSILANELRVGVEYGYSPFSYLGEDNKPHGFDIDIANAICDTLKVTCIIKHMEFIDLIPAMEADKIDIIVASMAKTQERLKKIDFSIAYYRARGVAIGKLGDIFSPNTNDLKDKSIAVQSGTIQEVVAKELAHESTKIFVFDTFDEATNMLVNNKVDLILGDTLGAYFFLIEDENSTKFEITGLLPESSNGDDLNYAFVGIKKNDHILRENINNAIQTIHQNGTLGNLSRKYFPFEIY